MVLFGWRILARIRPARRALIERKRDGVVLLDREARTARVYPTAGAILRIPGGRVPGLAIQELVPLEVNSWAKAPSSAHGG